jgi:hypothetical protein
MEYVDPDLADEAEGFSRSQLERLVIAGEAA